MMEKKHIYSRDSTVNDCEHCPFHRYSNFCNDGDQWYCILNGRFVIDNPDSDEECCGMKGKRIRESYEEIV